MSKPVRVLYAEDMPVCSVPIIKDMEAAGFTVTHFQFVDEARAAFVPGKYDLVVLDGKTRRHDDGWIWARELWDDGRQAVVVLSSSSAPEYGVPSVDKIEHDAIEQILEKLTAGELVKK